MLPLRLSRVFDRAPAPLPAHATPSLARISPQPAPPSPPLEAVAPAPNRRMQGNRRQSDRREGQQPAFLDTRSGSGRRRTPGRRADDQEIGIVYKRISITA